MSEYTDQVRVLSAAISGLFLDPLAAQRVRWAEEEKRLAELRKTFAAESLQVIALLIAAMQHPDIGGGDMETARHHFAKALEASRELDPMEEEEEREPEPSMTMDEHLDDPRRGQANSINRSGR